MRGFSFSAGRFSPAGGWRTLILGAEDPDADGFRRVRTTQPDWIDELDEHRDGEATRLAFEGELSDVIAARTGTDGSSRACRGARQPAKAQTTRTRRGR